MAAFAEVERTTVGLNTFSDRRNHHVGFGIPISVGVATQVVGDQIGDQIAAHVQELTRWARRDPGRPGSEVLRGLRPPDAASIGRPGIDTGVAGRPGFPSETSCRTFSRSAGSER